MTKTEFTAVCGKYLIAVDIALENDNVRKALTERNDKAVIEALETEF